MPHILKFLTIFAAFCHFSYATSAIESVAGFFGFSGGTWIKKVILTSSNDMNWLDNMDHPKDSGPNSAKVAFVFCNDDKLKDELKKMSGPDFIKNMAAYKVKNSQSVYIVVEDVVPSENKTIDISPKDDDSVGQKIYNGTKFVLVFVGYQTPGNHILELPMDQDTITLLFGPKDVSVQLNKM
ncbi:MAG: hypothetical protein KBD31_05290 [Proteobacteria bacterium]|nr:hypothetical protein [Pseudomonadota bacterium]